MAMAVRIAIRLGVSVAVMGTACGLAPPSWAQQATPSAGAMDFAPMKLADALNIISERTGVRIDYDSDAADRVESAPVSGARSAADAVRQAVRGTGLNVRRENGGFLVSRDIMVVARRDEAETRVLVRQASTSDRSGQTLREVPRNTQIISARTIAEQQSLDVNDILRNAGGVTTNPGNSQGGATYTVRGFASGGLVNGVAGSGNFGVTLGSSQPIANIERVEVLKGPDALLAGANNLGGNINVVTKRPSADRLLAASIDTGSFGLFRAVGDVNGALTKDRKLTARLTGSLQRANRSYGGYRGAEDDLLAPSLRYKNSRSDFIVAASFSRSITPQPAYTFYDVPSATLLQVPTGRFLFTPDQYLRVTQRRYSADLTQRIGDHITLVARGQHEQISLRFHQYSYAGVNRAGLPGYFVIGSAQRGRSNAIDTYARLTGSVGGIKATANIGYNHSDGSALYLNPPVTQTVRIPSIFDTSIPVPPLLDPNVRNILSNFSQDGVYAQGLIEFWKLHITGGFRRNWYANDSYLYSRNTPGTPNSASATTPNLGAVLDVTPNISIFGNYVEGFQPAGTQRTYLGERLPNIESLNKEVGLKIDLFNKNAILNASYFWLKQSNSVFSDPAHPGFFIAQDGQLGEGVDVNVAGTLLPGWTVQSSFTRTEYRRSVVTATAQVVTNQPRDKYSLYTTYRHRVSNDTRLGVGVGLYGQSSSWASISRQFSVPASRQLDVNLFGETGRLSLNLGVRNLLDRRNYGSTSTVGFIPINEPRNWRLTAGYRF